MQLRDVHTILIIIYAPHAASRQKLRGIYQFLSEKPDWDIRLVRTDSDLTEDIVAACENGEYDGVILHEIPSALPYLQRILQSKVPVVAIEIDPALVNNRRAKTILMETDNTGIGRLAAQYLLSLGKFASFAYIPDDRHRPWSVCREEAFRQALAEKGLAVDVYVSQRETLDVFLSRQPRPAAVFAAWDYQAAQVVSTCRKARLRVPDDISVLGVDDDDFICESVRPTISTILVDRIRQGYTAAKALDALIFGRKVPKPAVCKPLHVIERESARAIASTKILVERAVRYINEHVSEELTPQHVARALRVSRRLLDLRFAESEKNSVAEFIRHQKLIVAQKLLRATSLPDDRIAARCGFKSVNSFRNIFRRQLGCSPQQFRTNGKP